MEPLKVWSLINVDGRGKYKQYVRLSLMAALTSRFNPLALQGEGGAKAEGGVPDVKV